jgi:hypothetical protein
MVKMEYESFSRKESYLSYIANINAMKTNSAATMTVKTMGRALSYCSLKADDGYISKNIWQCPSTTPDRAGS